VEVDNREGCEVGVSGLTRAGRNGRSYFNMRLMEKERSLQLEGATIHTAMELRDEEGTTDLQYLHMLY
jgi:hypothetical protein